MKIHQTLFYAPIFTVFIPPEGQPGPFIPIVRLENVTVVYRAIFAVAILNFVSSILSILCGCTYKYILTILLGNFNPPSQFYEPLLQSSLA